VQKEVQDALKLLDTLDKRIGYEIAQTVKKSNVQLNTKLTMMSKAVESIGGTGN